MATLDEHIAQSLRESQRSGELQSAPSWGKPLHLNALRLEKLRASGSL